MDLQKVKIASEIARELLSYNDQEVPVFRLTGLISQIGKVEGINQELDSLLKQLYRIQKTEGGDCPVFFSLSPTFRKSIKGLLRDHAALNTAAHLQELCQVDINSLAHPERKNRTAQIKALKLSLEQAAEGIHTQSLLDAVIDTLLAADSLLKQAQSMKAKQEQGLNGIIERRRPAEVSTRQEPVRVETDRINTSVSNTKPEPAKNNPPIRSNSKGVMSMAELEQMEFDLLEFTGRWKEFIGEPQRNFYAICYGKPKNGKSYMSLQFAKYMSRFGSVLYNAAEEGFAPTLRKKLQEVGITANSRVFVSPARSLKDLAKDIDSHQPLSAVFVDSVSIHTMDNTEFDEFRRRWPNTAFICVMHATKNGDFRGGQAWTHDCDVIIKVEDGQAEQRGRFGMGEFDVFEDMLAEE